MQDSHQALQNSPTTAHGDHRSIGHDVAFERLLLVIVFVHCSDFDGRNESAAENKGCHVDAFEKSFVRKDQVIKTIAGQCRVRYMGPKAQFRFDESTQDPSFGT